MAVRCIINTCSDEVFKDLVARHITRSDILRELGLRVGQGYYNRLLNNRVKTLGLNTSHWVGGKHPVGRYPSNKAIPLDVLCVPGSSAIRGSLKSRLLKAGILQNKCYKCGLDPEWQGEPLSLHLDHIDGDNTNNTIGNLRILCPNCHSQTPTFGSKRYKKIYTCACGAVIQKGSDRCKTCVTTARRGHGTKINWPSPDSLLKLLSKGASVESIGRGLGVSGTAVKNHLQGCGLWIPRQAPRGRNVPHACPQP